MRVHDDWLLTPQRAAVHLPTATAVVADLHLGYGEARRARGEAVPVPALTTCLAPLATLAATAAVRRLVIAGDLFEDGCSEQLTGELLSWAAAVGLEITAVVPGNHDRHPERSAGRLPLRPEGVCLGEWHIVHGDGELPAGAVMHGHVHPCLRWGRHWSAACYLVTTDRVVLPAFSTDARGVNMVRDATWKSYRCYAIAEGRVFDMGQVADIDRGLTR